MNAAALLAAATSVAALFGPASTHALPRATEDRADDVAGPQIHFVYAVPQDRVDRQLDTSGALEGSATSFLQWLSRQTGGATLRADRYQGSLDITFVRLAGTDAAIAARGAFVRDAVEEELHRLGFNRADRIYSVYYDGSSTYSCGGAAWPPVVPGNTVVMYLHGTPACYSQGFVGANQEPGYWEYAMLHDTLHALGVVPTCAPHHTLSGHVSDSPSDLMYSGSEPWRFPLTLDIGRDDYYRHGHAGCLDLATSPYLTTSAVPTLTSSSFALTRARAGHRLTARLSFRLANAPLSSARATCSATLAGRSLRILARGITGATARCSWGVPRRSAGKRVTGVVRVTSGALAVTRRFMLVVGK